jgi:hypothetical protein
MELCVFNASFIVLLSEVAGDIFKFQAGRQRILTVNFFGSVPGKLLWGCGVGSFSVEVLSQCFRFHPANQFTD